MPEIVVPARQRRSVRRAVTTDCQVVSEHEFVLVGHRAVDVSAEGLLVESRLPASIGDPVIISMRAPGTRWWLDAEARVARIIRGLRRSDEGRFFGLRFISMSALDRAVLRASLEGRPPPLPRRRVRRDYATTVRLISAR